MAGTPQAQEAVIANSIPQTATIVRSEARLTVVYDGAPQFWPIEGTPLQYAVNSPTPVIRVDAKTYYALYNGVWFVAAAPVGPWAAATYVPAVVYTVPITSPLHYVTYVRIYGYTPTVVYVGYTPGYLGTVVAPDGVVVYGTGVVYTPWVGTVWYPPPTTYYSSGSQFAWGAATGFMMGTMTGLAIGAAAWGGGCCCCGSSNVNINKTVNNYTVNGSNVYHSWDSKTVVSSGDKSATVYRTPNSSLVTNNQNNNVYASHDGNVYRQDDGSWQKWNSSSQSWQSVQNPRTSSTTTTTATQPTSTPSAQSEQEPRSGSSQTGQSMGGQRSQSQDLSGQRFGGDSGERGGWGGFSRQGGSPSESLERDSWARDRGFERFGGGGFGGFRGFRR